MSSFFHKIKKAVTDPHAAVQYFKQRRWRDKNYTWEKTPGAVKKKRYKTYADYLRHQKSKLQKIKSTWLLEQDRHYAAVLKERLMQNGVTTSDKSVLCLGARTGAEVQSFLDLGCFAIGIDLNPGRENKYVVFGDFHHLQFPDNIVDIVYTNSLDHALNLDKIIGEIKRVLKPDGIFIVEVMKGVAEGVTPRYYESLSWETVDALLSYFLKAGFNIMKRSDFSYPWNGEHVVLIKKHTSAWKFKGSTP